MRQSEFVCVGSGQQVFIHAEHLRYFQRTAFELTQRLVNIIGVVGMQFLFGGFTIEGLFGVIFQIITTDFGASTHQFHGPLHFGGRDTILGFDHR